MRNFRLGVARRDLMLFAGTAVAAFAITVLWDLLLVDSISLMFPNNSQIANKYVLTFLMYGLAFLVAILSLFMARRNGGETTRVGLIAGFLIRFGIALEVFGILITPIGLFHATNPTRSVPVGFTFFACVFVGIVLAGIGGNIIAPRRA
jgi:uncharacterized membrane protein YjgN (DUF898 family)